MARNVAASIPPNTPVPMEFRLAAPAPDGDHKRKHTQNKGHRGHDDRPETKLRRFERGITQRLARSVALIGKFDDQDRVFSGQPDQRHQPDLKIDVIGQSPESRWPAMRPKPQKVSQE